jgi:hypothetical protein
LKTHLSFEDWGFIKDISDLVPLQGQEIKVTEHLLWKIMLTTPQEVIEFLQYQLS